MYVVRFRHLVLRQQKYNMRQWVASTVVARQLCSVQLQLLPYLTLPVVNLFWLAGVFFSALKSAGHECCYQGLKWMGTLFSGPPFLQFGVPRPQTAFFSWKCMFPGRKGSSIWEYNFFSELINLNLVKITAWLEIQGPAAKLNGAHRFFYKGPIIFIVPTILKLHLTPAVSLLYIEKL